MLWLDRLMQQSPLPCWTPFGFPATLVLPAPGRAGPNENAAIAPGGAASGEQPHDSK
jgi:hypothetical protein